MAVGGGAVAANIEESIMAGLAPRQTTESPRSE